MSAKKGELRVRLTAQERRVRGKTVDLESTPYVLQFWDDQENRWEPLGPNIDGRSAAYKVLQEQQKAYPTTSWRVQPKSIAEGYREGVKDGSGEPKHRKQPLLAPMPYLKRVS